MYLQGEIGVASTFGSIIILLDHCDSSKEECASDADRAEYWAQQFISLLNISYQ